jgi:parvulin-like peptidyl-prolyl isomerase
MRSGMKPVMIIVAVVFVGAIFLWGAGQLVSTLFGGNSGEMAAEVNGQKITLQQFAHRYNLTLRQMEENKELSEAQRNELADRVLNEMVEEDLWIAYAHSIGLKVNDEELRTFLNNRYGIGTSISQEQYQQMVGKIYGIDRGGGNMTEALREFENINRRALLVAKAQSIVITGARLPEPRLRTLFEATERPMTYDMVVLDGTQLLKTTTVTDAESEAWYNAHPDFFFSPTRASLEILSWSQSAMASTVTVSQAELEDYYEEHKFEESQNGKARYSSILLADVKAGTAEIAKLQEQGKTLVADFRKQSENMIDPAQRDTLWWDTVEKTSKELIQPGQRKGDLGFMTSETVEQRYGAEASNAILGIFPGDVTDPIVTKDGLRIFRREEDYYPLEWKKDIYQQRVAFDKAGKMALDLAETARGRMAQGEDAQTLATELKANHTITKYFIALPPDQADSANNTTQTIPGLNPATDFRVMRIFAYRNKQGEVAPVMTVDPDAAMAAQLGTTDLPPGLLQGKVYYAYKINDRQSPGVLPLDQVKEQAYNMARAEKIRNSLKAQADAIATAAKSSNLAAAAQANGATVTSIIGQSLMQSGQIAGPYAAHAVMNLEPGQISEPISSGVSWIIVQMKSKTEFNQAIYDGSRSNAADSYRNGEAERITRAWVAEQLARGQENGKIKIYAERSKDFLAGKYKVEKNTAGSGGYY